MEILRIPVNESLFGVRGMVLLTPAAYAIVADREEIMERLKSRLYG